MDNQIQYIKKQIKPMGCASTSVQQRRVLPIPPQQVNFYLDKFPAIIIQKIKQKFSALADPETRQIDCLAFMKLHINSTFSQDALTRLYSYFNDHQDCNLKWRRYMMKYATITKCQPTLLFRIFYEIYKTNMDQELLTRAQFEYFIGNNRQYLEKVPYFQEKNVPKEIFVDMLKSNGFKADEYQKMLIITTQDDAPFQAISSQIHECDFNDLTEGKQYYLISEAWFERWSFYYEEADHNFDRSNIKSTKLLAPFDKTVPSKRKKRTFGDGHRRSSSLLRMGGLNNSLLEQPNTISFDDIQGEFKGQLKEKLNVSTQLKTITDNLWRLMCSLHPPEQQFKRMAVNYTTIDYYPKTIFYIEADQKGQYIIESQTIKHLSINKVISDIINIEKLTRQFPEYGIFTKNFFQKNWKQINPKKAGSDISLEPRFFIVIAKNRQNFYEKQFRQQITTKNIDLGDRVFAYFAYIKDSAEAVIIERGKQDTFKLHFKKYSYKYESTYPAQQLVIEQNDEVLSSFKKKKQSLVKGISNIGNTCFINSVLECLVASPIFDKFMKQNPFDEIKHPVGSALGKVVKALLQNSKPPIYSFKKAIDSHMPQFSGYNQHDAQQFMNLLLDKVSQELTEKPTVIDYVFGGKTVSRLTCLSCKKQKNIPEKMYILSLPIPEPQYNYFNIVVVPVTSKVIKKVIFKLHKSATVSDYINAFEEKTGENGKDFNFCESSNNTLKSIKGELLALNYQDKNIMDIGIVPNIEIMAFEKIPFRYYYDELKKMSTEFKDFKRVSDNPSQTYWTICKANTKKSSLKQSDKKGTVAIEHLNQEEQLQVVKLDKEAAEENMMKLGSVKVEPIYKKLLMRKYNSSFKKYQTFGLQFLIGIPKWASYNAIIGIIEKYLQNLKKENAKYHSNDEKGDYNIKLVDSKNRCIFCLKQLPIINVSQIDLLPCCSAFDKNIPLAWVTKCKRYGIYVNWINFSACNSMFCSYIQLDAISRNVEQTKQQEFINLESCIKLLNEKEKVEMECDDCKGKQQMLEHLIDGMPNILIVHMKQFRYTSQGHLVKLDLRLKWQQYLDSSKFSLTVHQGKLYELFAVVKHSGNSQSGHYTCMTKRKHPFENKKVWINFDDDTTDIMDDTPKVIDDAYLLLYKKVDMPTSSLVIYADLKQGEM